MTRRATPILSRSTSRPFVWSRSVPLVVSLVWAVILGWWMAAVLTGLLAGSGVRFADLVPTLIRGLSSEATDLPAIVIAEIHLPRVLIAVLGGAAFAAAGLMLQEGLGNPLATPELLGVAPGAALMTAGVQTLQLDIPQVFVPALALIGGLAGGALVLLASAAARSGQAILLIGAAVSAALSGLLIAVMSAAEGFQARALLRFLSGSLADVAWDQAEPAAWWLLVLLPVTALSAPTLGVLRLGPATAAALGINVARARLMILLIATVLVCVVVPVCGPLAWIGLLSPAIARRCLPRAGSLQLLALSAVTGGALTVSADVLARSVFNPIETPLGAWTSGVTVLLAAGAPLAGSLMSRCRERQVPAS